MYNPVSEELMFANVKAQQDEVRRAFHHSSTRADVRRWWRASQEKRAARRTR